MPGKMSREGWMIGANGHGDTWDRSWVDAGDVIWWNGRAWGQKDTAQVFPTQEDADAKAVELVLRGITNARSEKV